MTVFVRGKDFLLRFFSMAYLGYFLRKIYPARAGFENFCAVLKLIPRPRGCPKSQIKCIFINFFFPSPSLIPLSRFSGQGVRANVRFAINLNNFAFNFAFETPPGGNCDDLRSFSLRKICLIFFCDDWRNLLENYSARIAVGLGCGLAALGCTKTMLTVALVYGNPSSINKRWQGFTRLAFILPGLGFGTTGQRPFNDSTNQLF
ncbi:hypothetical protein ACX8XP_08160 [Calditrichota bacterium LG25]